MASTSTCTFRLSTGAFFFHKYFCRILIEALFLCSGKNLIIVLQKGPSYLSSVVSLFFRLSHQFLSSHLSVSVAEILRPPPRIEGPALVHAYTRVPCCLYTTVRSCILLMVCLHDASLCAVTLSRWSSCSESGKTIRPCERASGQRRYGVSS